MGTPNALFHASRRTHTTESVRSRVATVIANPNLLAIAAISLIGLLLSLNLIFRFPDFGAVIEQFNQF